MAPETTNNKDNAPSSYSRAARITFLSLPETVRDRIYSEMEMPAGFTLRIISSTSPYSYAETMRWFTEFDLHLWCITAHSWPFTLAWPVKISNHVGNKALANSKALASTNSLVRADVARFLFQKNDILLCCDSSEDFDLLRRMPPSISCLLQQLTIHVPPSQDLWLPEEDHQALCNHYNRFLKGDSKAPKLPPREREQVLETWRWVATKLAEMQRNTKLVFKVVCESDDLDGLLRPLTHSLHENGVAVTAARFGVIRDPRLIDLARKTVLPMEPEIPPFRFFDLPPELQHHILSFTDLVTPEQHIECRDNGMVNRPKNAYGLMWDSCGRDPFCERKDLGKSIWPPCGCWEPPTALFLVCKEMLHLVRTVFYGQNRFIVGMDFDSKTWADVHNRPDGSNCLGKALPDVILPYLRHLEILFTPPSGLDESAYNDWAQSVHHLGTKVKSLELRLYMAQQYDPRQRTARPPPSMPTCLNALIPAQEQIARPWADVAAVSDCFIRAVQTNLPIYSILRHDFDPVRLRAHERRLEEMVMGEGYDSIKRGKLEQEQSIWVNC